jgi:hypothetical protein
MLVAIDDAQNMLDKCRQSCPIRFVACDDCVEHSRRRVLEDEHETKCTLNAHIPSVPHEAEPNVRAHRLRW